MNKCQAAAFYSKEDVILCQNEAEDVRKITFGTWHVYATLCGAHIELWDALDQNPMIVKRIGRKRKPSP